MGELSGFSKIAEKTHFRGYRSRFLDPEGFHHLEDVHYSLSFTALNGCGYSTEHSRTTDCVTTREREREREIDMVALRS